MADAGVRSVWLDLQNGVVHAALSYLPQNTQYGFPKQSPEQRTQKWDAVLLNVSPDRVSPRTRQILQNMVLVSEMEGWRLYIAKDRATSAWSSTNLPPLSGITKVTGLGEWQGPYPEWNIPRFAVVGQSEVSFQIPPNTNATTLEIKKSPNWSASVYRGDHLLTTIPKETASEIIPLEADPASPAFRIVPGETPSQGTFQLEALQVR
jgi:hypothetical protein